MAAGLANGAPTPPGGGRRRGRRRSYTPMAQINVTPFVDVMLVLLIVFMVTAPLLTVGVPLELPRTRAQAINEPVEPLVVSIDGDGRVFIQETEVSLDRLVPRLRAVTGRKPDTRIYVRGDQGLPYGRVMQVMGRINGAGFSRVALVTEQDLPDGR